MLRGFTAAGWWLGACVLAASVGCCGGSGIPAELSAIDGGYQVSGVWGLDATLIESAPGSWSFLGSVTYPTTGFETEGPTLTVEGPKARLTIDVTPPSEGTIVLPVLTEVPLSFTPMELDGTPDWDIRLVTACPVS